MLTRREYAASLGLAKPNSRGRLSLEAHAAIEAAEANGMQFKDSKPAAKPKPEPVKVTPAPTPLSLPRPSAPIRNARAFVATLHDGQVIEFGTCGRCKNHVSWCKCANGPQPPAWVADEVDSWVEVPKG